MDIVKSSKFNSDIKKLKKKHYNFKTLENVLIQLTQNKQLSKKYKDHYLKGDKQGYKECHIENNIILIYQIIDNKLILYRIGNHKDLLNK